MPSVRTLTREQMLDNMLLDDEVEKAENKLAWARKFRQQHKVKGRKPILSAQERAEFEVQQEVKRFESKKREEKGLLPF